jgi:aminoglycoside phosphotransferase (APT) family kinase protein
MREPDVARCGLDLILRSAFDSMHTRLHADELRIDDKVVHDLLAAQFPRYSKLPIARLDATGSSNALFRLGDDLLVRLPRQPGGGTAIRKEHRWLPLVAPNLPVAVPEFVAVGEPGCGYGESWAIVRWLDGERAEAFDTNRILGPDRAGLAADLADVVLALRHAGIPGAATADLALRAYRGEPLGSFDRQVGRNIELCGAIEDLGLDLGLALAVWEDALKLPGAFGTGRIAWLHGDLVAENLLHRAGRLTAVLDFGDLAVGDPTIDLHGAWEVLDGPARALFRARLDVDDAEWRRGRAWALAIALGTFSYYWRTMPGRCRDRWVMASSVLADAADGAGP